MLLLQGPFARVQYMPDFSLLAVVVTAFYGVALICVYRILLSYRTAQGAIAWIMSLIGMPWIAVPFSCCSVATASGAMCAPDA